MPDRMAGTRSRPRNLPRVEVLHDVGSCPRPDVGTVVTIGAYDGVHLGHQAVIAAVRRRADAGGMESAVVTFDRHPAAVVRPESPFDAPPSVRVIRGSALDPELLRQAGEGCEGVISCVGPQRVNPANPWSPLRPPPGVATRSARAAASVLEGRRFVAISAAGVGDSRPLVNAPMRALLRWSTIGAMYADLESMEAVLRGSSLDWTIELLGVVRFMPVTSVTLLTSQGLCSCRRLSAAGRHDG